MYNVKIFELAYVIMLINKYDKMTKIMDFFFFLRKFKTFDIPLMNRIVNCKRNF